MTYLYRCEACGHEWEAEHKITAEPLKKCPKCGKPRAKRLINAKGGFRLEGTGWARDGYK